MAKIWQILMKLQMALINIFQILDLIWLDQLGTLEGLIFLCWRERVYSIAKRAVTIFIDQTSDKQTEIESWRVSNEPFFFVGNARIYYKLRQNLIRRHLCATLFKTFRNNCFIRSTRKRWSLNLFMFLTSIMLTFCFILIIIISCLIKPEGRN